MCDCIKEIKEKWAEKYPEATDIIIEHTAYFWGKLPFERFVGYAITKRKQGKRTIKIQDGVIFKFCPICGQAYEVE